jgi:hypothetical protein
VVEEEPAAVALALERPHPLRHLLVVNLKRQRPVFKIGGLPQGVILANPGGEVAP